MSEARRNTSKDLLTSLVSPDEWEDWSVQAASREPIVQEVMGIFVKFKSFGDEATEDVCKDALEEHLVAMYGIPAERCDEVFEIAKDIVQQEMDSNGQA